MLDKEISNILRYITDQWDTNTVQISIKEILLTKRKRASNEREYFNSLCENVIYLIESCRVIKALIEESLKQKTIYETSQIESIFENIQNNIKKDMKNLLNKYKNELTKSTIRESIEHVEFLYRYSKLKYDMEIDFLFAFIHPNNRSVMTVFLNYEPIEVVTTLDKASDAYTSLFIPIDFTNGSKNSPNKPENKGSKKEIATTHTKNKTERRIRC